MPTVTMPQLGESIEEGTIGKWLKNVGDPVLVGDPLVEVITDKVNAEVPSPFAGTLTKILVQEGDTVVNEAVIAEVEESAASKDASAADTAAAADTEVAAVAVVAEAKAEPETAPAAPAPAAAPAMAPAPPVATATATSAPAREVEVPAANTSGNGASKSAVAIPIGIRMTPAVRRLAREKGIDVATIKGSGSGGRITRADVEGAATSAPAPVAAPPPKSATAAAPADSPVAEGDSLKRLSPMRKAIAAHMTKFLDVPTAYITIEVDMTAVVRARTALNVDYRAREGMGLSYVAYMTKACVEALKKHHDLNGHWTEEGHWRRKDINIGIAVAVPDGLLVPVIKNAETLSIHGLNVAINDLAKRSRTKKIKPDELRGGTFTVNNTGWTGSVLTLPIINVPEIAIVTMEKIVKRPVVITGPDGEDVIAIRHMMNMAIAIDHRATDGAQAGAFLTDVQNWLEGVGTDTPIW